MMKESLVLIKCTLISIKSKWNEGLRGILNVKSQIIKYRKRSCFIYITCIITCQPSSITYQSSSMSKHDRKLDNCILKHMCNLTVCEKVKDMLFLMWNI